MKILERLRKKSSQDTPFEPPLGELAKLEEGGFTEPYIPVWYSKKDTFLPLESRFIGGPLDGRDIYVPDTETVVMYEQSTWVSSTKEGAIYSFSLNSVNMDAIRNSSEALKDPPKRTVSTHIAEYVIYYRVSERVFECRGNLSDLLKT